MRCHSTILAVTIALFLSGVVAAQTEPKEKKAEKVKEIKAKIEKLEKRLAELSKDDAANQYDPKPEKKVAETEQKTFTLKFVVADATAATLTKLLAKTKDTRVVANAATNQVLVVGTAKTLKKAEKLLRRLDVESK